MGSLVVLAEPLRAQNKVAKLLVLLRRVRSRRSKHCAATSLVVDHTAGQFKVRVCDRALVIGSGKMGLNVRGEREAP